MAAPVYQTKGTRIDTAGAATVVWPAHLTDDIALLVVESANEVVTLSTPAGFAEVTGSPQGTGTAGGTTATRITLFWCRATSAAMASPVVADAGNHVVAQILTFRGCKKTGDPWNVTAGDALASASTSVSIPGAVTTVDQCLVVAIATTATDASPAVIGSWVNASLVSITEREDIGGTLGNGGGYGVATGEKAVAGTYSATTATFGTSTVQGRLSVALAPAAAVLTADSGSYTITGTAVGLLLGHVLALGSGSYALTGTDVGLYRGSTVAVASGTYTLTGSDANLVYTPASNHLLVIDPGSYALTGSDVALKYGRVVSVASGSYALTGTDVGLKAQRVLPIASGAYALSGTDAALKYGRALALASGSYVLSGTDVQLVYEPLTGYVLGIAPGSYTLTGTDCALHYGRALSLGSGSYVLTGSAVSLVKAGLGIPIAKHHSTGVIPSPHRSTGTVRTFVGESVTRTYTGDNDVITGDTTLLDGSVTPGMG